MKRITALLLAAMLILSLAACGGTSETNVVSSTEEAALSESVAQESSLAEEETPEEPVAEEAASPEEVAASKAEEAPSEVEPTEPEPLEEASEQEETDAGEAISVTAEYTPGEWNDAVFSYDGGEMNYSVYVPESFDGTVSLPLITYIPDATYSNSSLSELKAAQCPTAWITEDNMSENPCLFLLIEIASGDSDITNSSNDSSRVVPIIDEVVSLYAADENRLYLTGQSMGGIFDFAINDAYPDKFAATVYVACQPGGEPYDDQYNAIIENKNYLNQTFVYIASAMDPKSPQGQASVMEALDEAGIEYGLLQNIDHEGGDTTEAAVAEVLGQGHQQNILQFTSVAGGSPPQEHMQSFQYAYNINAIFEWLMEQSL